MRLRFLEYDYPLSAHHNQELIAGLDTQSLASLAWNHNLVL